MSYDLVLWPESGVVDPRALSQFFKGVNGCTPDGGEVTYDNPHTGTHFVIDVAPGDEELHRAGLQFEVQIPYFRPSYTAREIEPILSRFVAEFGLLVDDPQINGMPGTTYEPGRFLSGWDTGNRFAHESILSSPDFDQSAVRHRPKAELDSIFQWNYSASQRKGSEALHPVMWLDVDGQLTSAAVWDLSGGVLPAAEYVLFVVNQRVRFRQLRADIPLPFSFVQAGFAEAGITFDQASGEPVSPKGRAHVEARASVTSKQGQHMLSWISTSGAQPTEVTAVGFDHVLESELVLPQTAAR
jgi:hypothetical protein